MTKSIKEQFSNVTSLILHQKKVKDGEKRYSDIVMNKDLSKEEINDLLENEDWEYIEDILFADEESQTSLRSFESDKQ